MKLHWSTSDQPQILILMVLLMHPELRLSTIKITTGLTVANTRAGLVTLLEKKIVEKITTSSQNPTFRLIDIKGAKLYLDELARQKMVQI